MKTTDLHTSVFGKTGLHVTSLGFGGGEVGLLDVEQERASRILNLLLDAGVNVIDTAASYNNSEQLIGDAIGHRRDEFVLISKCGGAVKGLEGKAWSAELIAHSIERSLERLKTDHIDVMLLHSCDLETLRKGEALVALWTCQRAGKVRFVGYSGDNHAAEYAASIPDLNVLETSINICDQANIDTVLPRAIDNNLGVIAKRPIANAAWRDDLPGFFADYAKEYRRRFEKMKLTPADLGFDDDPKQAWPEIALRFTLSQPGVHTAIIGTHNPDNARVNIAYAEKGPLPDETIAKIRDAFRRAQREDDTTWEGKT